MTGVLSIDVGGTKTRIGLVDAAGAVTHEHDVPTRVGADDVTRVVHLAVVAVAQTRPDAVAVGFPEYVGPDGRLTSTEVLTWATQPASALAAALAPHGLGADRIVIDSDVRLGAVGEAAWGSGRGVSSLLYVSLGTGLSSTLVLGGDPWPGARGEGIGLGEFHTDDGTLESQVSGAGIQARYEAATGQSLTGRELAARAAAGDPGVRRMLTGAGVLLGDALADAVALLDPERVVLGGGWGTADTPLVSAAFTQYRTRVSRRPGAPPAVRAALGHRSGLLGGGVRGLRALDPTFLPDNDLMADT